MFFMLLILDNKSFHLFSDCILGEKIFLYIFILCNLTDRYPIRKHYYSITRSSGSSAILYGTTPTGKLSQILGNRERSIEKLHKGFGITILWFGSVLLYSTSLLDRWIDTFSSVRMEHIEKSHHLLERKMCRGWFLTQREEKIKRNCFGMTVKYIVVSQWRR